MTTLREAAQQALEALESTQLYCAHEHYPRRRVADALAALKAALEQPEQEPVAWIQPDHLQKARRAPFSCRVEPTQRWADFVPLYTHPPRREWRSLSEEEIRDLWSWSATAEAERTATTQQHAFARAVEAALKERNI